MRHLVRYTFIRFLIAGAANTLFGWVVYSIAILSGLEPWAALICGTVMGIAFNFCSIGGYAFRQLTLRYFPRFIASYVFIYMTNLGCLHLMALRIENP